MRAIIEDQSFVEANLFSILQFMVNIKPLSTQLLRSFYDQIMEEQGIWYAEDMMVPDQATIKKYDEAGLLETRTLLWADLKTFNSLDLENQTKINGIKIFLDGALGYCMKDMSQGYIDIKIDEDKQLISYKVSVK